MTRFRRPRGPFAFISARTIQYQLWGVYSSFFLRLHLYEVYTLA